MILSTKSGERREVLRGGGETASTATARRESERKPSGRRRIVRINDKIAELSCRYCEAGVRRIRKHLRWVDDRCRDQRGWKTSGLRKVKA